MWRMWMLGLVASGCGFAPRAATDGSHDGGSDAHVPVDAALLDAAPDHACFGMLAIDQVCFANADLPTSSLNFNEETTFDTDSTGACTSAVPSSGNPACVIAATSFTLSSSAKVHLTGSKPVIFVATTETGTGINLNAGAILDSSTYETQLGAGAMLVSCGLGTTGTEPVSKGGGYGGSFVALGGVGGTGDVSMSTGGAPPPTIPAAALHGGCPGGIGQGNEMPRARGGGAIALIASTISNDGLIVAGGDGGATTELTFRGGNGGAAGGLIVLDAKALLKGNGSVEARGGGGGQGLGGNAGQGVAGGAGYNPSDRALDGKGGTGTGTTGGFGGDGGPRSLNNTGGNGVPGTVTAAGGGGGGAAGVIFTSITPAGSLAFKPNPN